jgi:hypothetical protein
MNGEVTRLDLLLIERVEHRPAAPPCRACGAGARAVTDADWPACPRFEEAVAVAS